MKGTEVIAARILNDARAQADAILAEARAQAGRIRSEWDERAARLREERLAAGRQAAADRTDSLERLARMEERRNLLALKQELLAEAFEKAQKDILSLPRENYIRFLGSLAADAAVTGTEEIVLNERDRKEAGREILEEAQREVLKKGLPASLSLSAADGDFAGGLILRRGDIEVNCTLELLTELCRQSLSSEAAALLFD